MSNDLSVSSLFPSRPRAKQPRWLPPLTPGASHFNYPPPAPPLSPSLCVSSAHLSILIKAFWLLSNIFACNSLVACGKIEISRALSFVPNAELISQIFAINELIKCPEMFTNCAEHVVCSPLVYANFYLFISRCFISIFDVVFDLIKLSFPSRRINRINRGISRHLWATSRVMLAWQLGQLGGLLPASGSSPLCQLISSSSVSRRCEKHLTAVKLNVPHVACAASESEGGEGVRESGRKLWGMPNNWQMVNF